MASTTAKRWRMRCGVSKCRTRFTLKKHPDLYKRKIKCPCCGDHLKVRDVEAERRRELAKQEQCECGGLPFKHRKGSYFACSHHRDAGKDWTEEQGHHYEAMLRVKRSG